MRRVLWEIKANTAKLRFQLLLVLFSIFLMLGTACRSRENESGIPVAGSGFQHLSGKPTTQPHAKSEGDLAPSRTKGDDSFYVGPASKGLVPPLVQPNFKAQQASAAENQNSGSVGDVSVDGRPRPWDKDSYIRDPSAYLERIEPSRIHQTAPDDPAYARLLTPAGSTAERHHLEGLGSIPLTVVTEPGFPCTMASMDRGSFENGLTTITVQAGVDGRATAHFTATAGTVAQVRILAASPMARGTVSFLISINDLP